MPVQKLMQNINIYTDGGARGNPGPAAIGIYIEGDGRQIQGIGKRIGRTTNNFAEYTAILEALDFLLGNSSLWNKNTKVNFFMDSQLAYSQIVGLYKIKNTTLKDLLFKIREKEATLKLSIAYNFVPRSQNRKADKLVNLALDNKL